MALVLTEEGRTNRVWFRLHDFARVSALLRGFHSLGDPVYGCNLVGYVFLTLKAPASNIQFSGLLLSAHLYGIPIIRTCSSVPSSSILETRYYSLFVLLLIFPYCGLPWSSQLPPHTVPISAVSFPGRLNSLLTRSPSQMCPSLVVSTPSLHGPHLRCGLPWSSQLPPHTVPHLSCGLPWSSQLPPHTVPISAVAFLLSFVFDKVPPRLSLQVFFLSNLAASITVVALSMCLCTDHTGMTHAVKCGTGKLTSQDRGLEYGLCIINCRESANLNKNTHNVSYNSYSRRETWTCIPTIEHKSRSQRDRPHC